MQKVDLNAALRATGAKLSKSEKAEFLGYTVEELEKREAERKAPVYKAPLSSLIDPEVIAKGGMKKAAGYLDHIYKRSATLDEALEQAADLIADDASPDEWKLIQKARAALDIAGFLTVLTSIFTKQPV